MSDARLLEGLDASQRAAVTSDAAPLAVLAGAGSGKTRVLTRRIAWLADEGRVDPSHTLALTFTRKAASELVARLARLGVRRDVTAGTFHSVALAQLRRRAADHGRDAPTVLARKARLLVPLVGERGAAASVAAAEVAGEIEWAKARRITPERYADAVARTDRQPPRPAEEIARLYARYEREKRSKRLVDFDDLIWSCTDVMRRDPEFAATQRWRFRHLFVDELQDATPAQVALVRAWLGDRRDLTVVGDPDQAIYGFAGANPWYLADFAKHFPGGTSLRLGTNYRSSAPVVATARAALGDPGALPPVATPRGDGPAPTIREHESEAAEARAIAVELRRAPGGERAWSSAAILTRTNAQSAAFEAALAAEGVAFRVRGAQAFLARPEVRATLDEVRRGAHVAPDRDLLAHLRDLADAHAGGEERHEHAETLLQLAREYLAADGGSGSVDAFLSYLQVALRGESDLGGSRGVELLTFHRAKGLEFERVYVTGLERGLVPISHATSAAEVAEERRLLYVALSRAHTELHLSWARTRNGRKRSPSPWLARLEATVAGGDGAPEAGPGAQERLAGARERVRSARGAPRGPVPDEDRALFEALREWRLHQSRAAKVPAYVVFDDRTLAAMARDRPRDPASLLAVPGVGPIKADRYGEAVLALIGEHA